MAFAFGDCVPDVKPLVTDVHGRVIGEADAILDVIPPPRTDSQLGSSEWWRKIHRNIAETDGPDVERI